MHFFDNVNHKKLDRQIEGFNKWKYSSIYGSFTNKRGCINYYPGVGKTYIGLLAIEDCLSSDLFSTCMVLVPTTKLKKDWENNIKTFIGETLSKRVQVITIQTLQAHDTKFRWSTTLLVVDELHLFYSEDRISYITGNRIDYLHNLGLTGTYEDSTDRHLNLCGVFPVVDSITETEAKSNGFISNCLQYNLGISLTKEEYSIYQTITDEISLLQSKFENGFTGAIDLINNYHSKSANRELIKDASKLIQLVKSRKDALYNYYGKIKVCTDIVKKYNDLQFLVFSESTEFSDEVAKSINSSFKTLHCMSYHSNLSSRPLLDKDGNYYTYKSGVKAGQPKIFGLPKIKEFIENSFNSGEIKGITTAKALDIGANLKNVKLGIIASANSNENNQTQRKGRLTRENTSLFNPSILVNVYLHNTRDEDWLRRRQKSKFETIYWVDSVDEISYTPIPN